MIFKFDKDNTDELLARLQADDIVEIRGEDLINLLNGKNGGTRGRRPIEVDMSLFDKTVELWQAGRITAREAMKTLDLKPNTFYRRIKERSSNDMIDIKNGINEVKTQLQDIARDVKPIVEDTKQYLDIEREIAAEKIGAKLEEVGSRLALKHEVAREAREFKESKE